MGVIHEYKEMIKDTNRRILFVVCFVEAWNSYVNKPDFNKKWHILVAEEAVRRFVNSSKANYSEFIYNWFNVDFENTFLPILRWFAYDETIAEEVVTKRLDDNAAYYAKKQYFTIDTQNFVMKEVVWRLEQHREWLEEEKENRAYIKQYHAGN